MTAHPLFGDAEERKGAVTPQEADQKDQQRTTCHRGRPRGPPAEVCAGLAVLLLFSAPADEADNTAMESGDANKNTTGKVSNV